MGSKISIIGAGSAVFSLNLIRDLCLTPGLKGSTVSLMDVNPARLEAIHQLCVRYAEEMGARITAEMTTDRRASLDGADFVVNTALAGHHGMLRAGWEIAQRHGYRFGGSFHIMHDEAFWVNFHQLRLFDEVVQDVLELCPDAWYLQVANPVLAGITYLAKAYPEAKIVGLCHGFSGVYQIADMLGLDHERLSFEIPGVNHTVFLTHLYHDGNDVFPLLDQWIGEEAPAYWETNRLSDGLGPQAIDLYRRFGVFPIGDTCTPGGGAWPWWYHTDAETEQRWREDPAGWYERYFTGGVAKVAEIQRAARDLAIPVSQVFPPKHSGEVMVPMIEALATDSQRVLIGNILNSGDFVPGIPRDFAVEIPLLVGKRGIEGVKTLGLPPAAIAHIWHDRVAPVTLELEAYRTGSKARMLELIQFDPWTRSVDQARVLLDDILAMPDNTALKAHLQ